MPSVSDYIKMSAGEITVKEYRGFEMKKPQKAVLNIAVTSKRVIFYGMTKAAQKANIPSLTQEMRIEDIRGLEICEKRSQNTFVAFLGAAVFLTGLFGLYSPTTSFFFTLNTALKNPLYGGILVAAAGAAVFLLSYLTGPKETGVIIKGKNENLNSGTFSEKTRIKWGADSQKILCELGSVILDIQNDSEARIRSEDETGYDENYDNSEYTGEYYGDEQDVKSEEEEYSESLDLLEGAGEPEEEKRDDYLF